MRNRSRWVLGGLLSAAGILAAVLLIIQWVPGRQTLPDDALRVPQDVTSLQEALDRVAPGGTIANHSSADPVQGPIVIDVPNISVVSTGGRSTITGRGAEPAVAIQADGVLIRGFDIRAESIGILITASDCSLENLQIESDAIGVQLDSASRCQVRSIDVQAGRVGLELIDSGSAFVDELTVTGASEYGVRLRDSWNNTLRGFSLSENDIGISIEAASTDNVIDDGTIEFSSIAGIEIRGSNDNRVSNIMMDSVRIGVVLEGVTGTELQGGEIRGASVSGILLQQAIQNRVLETTIAGSQGTGIHLTQSAENTLSYNVMSDCSGAGLSLISSGHSLLFGNEVIRCLVGIQMERSAEVRVLRNRVSESDLCGFVLLHGGGSRLLDNTSTNDFFGMLVSESGGNTLLRNVIHDADRAGLLLVDTTGDNLVSDNQVDGCAWGLLLSGSTRDFITYNRLQQSDIGAMLTQLGAGVRIEGNTFLGNRIGLQHQTDVDLTADLEVLGISFPQRSDGASPVLTNNVFAGNSEFDIRNDAMNLLMAAGNWWGESRVRDTTAAVVSDGVSLDQSAWRGVVAIGVGSDDVRLLLGRIVQLVLADEGFRVIDLVGIGPSQRVWQALTDADVDLVWWSVSDTESESLVEGTSSVILPSFAYEGWSVIVSAQLADQLTEPSISGLAEWASQSGERLRYTATSALDEDAFDALVSAYGLAESVHSITQSDELNEVEALLKFGAVDVAIVRSLEETLTLSGFLAIDDDLHVLPRDSILMIVQGAIAEEHPQVQKTLTALGEQLTSDVLHDLVSRIRSLHKDPEDVAREFLQ